VTRLGMQTRRQGRQLSRGGRSRQRDGEESGSDKLEQEGEGERWPPQAACLGWSRVRRLPEAERRYRAASRRGVPHVKQDDDRDGDQGGQPERGEQIHATTPRS
jgi:hypothetical protein